MLIDDVVGEFNKAAAELQATEFRRPRTPCEWQRMAKESHPRDYSRLFTAVVPFIEAFSVLDQPGDRARAAAGLSPDSLGILRTFARAMSVLAVRREAPLLIAQGLTALAVLGGVDDVRDLTFYLATLYYSASKLGVDAPLLFGDIAALSPNSNLRALMREFPLRLPRDRDISAFGLRETVTSEGFDFV
jgi:hypothetical protein